MSRQSSVASALAVVALATAAALTPSVATAQAPENDDVGSARSVTAIPFDDTVDVADATIEDGEPTEICAPFASTVWYAVTLPDATDVYIDTAGSNYDTTIAVWSGSSFSDVELITCNDDTFAGLQAAVGFTAAAGTTYLVQVGAFFEAPTDAMLTIHIGEPPKTTGKPYIASGGMRGSSANAYVEQYDEATMTYSGRSIEVLDGSMRSKGDRPSSARMVVVSSYEEQYDETDGSYTWTQWFGVADLAPDQFAIDRRLRSARVDADLTLFGATCTDSPASFECIDLGPVDVGVDATWTGSGPLIRSQDRGSDSFEGARFRYRSNVSFRNATVGGGVGGDMELDFTDAMGTISRGANGYWNWLQAGGSFFGATSSMAVAAEQLAPMGMLIESSRFRGSYAQAFDEEYDEADGSYSYRDVALNIGESRTHGGRWYSFADVSVSSTTEWYDEAAQTVTFEQWFGYGPLDAGSIDRRLAGATATAEVTLVGITCTYHWDDGTEDCHPLGESSASVDVDWSGVGSTFTSSYSSSSQYDGQHVRFSGRSTNRAATANGAVTGGVVDWTLVDAGGSMGRNADGYWSKS